MIKIINKIINSLNFTLSVVKYTLIRKYKD